MRSFIEFFVRRPVTTVMFVLLFVVLGIVSFPRMNIERMPPIDLPMVTATFVYPGASPDEIESQVLKRAEDAISEISGVKKITSNAYENSGFVMAEFNIGVNVNDKATEVKTKIDSITGEFPDDLKQPIIEKLNPLAVPVMDIVISGADIRDIETYIDNVLSQKITAINGVSNVSIYGGRERAIRIGLRPDIMVQNGITINDVIATIGSHNLNVPAGKIEYTTDSNAVRFIGEFNSVSDIENINIVSTDGVVFPLNKIAEVSDISRDATTGARLNGENVVILSVVKTAEGNAIRISRDLRERLPLIESSMKSVFPNATMTIVSDSSTAIQAETNTTLRDIFLGLIFTVITLLVFTKNWRTTIIAGVMIPTSIIAGFFMMDAAGFSINSMTLLAIATALGVLICDAIVLIESALGMINRGLNPYEAAIAGTQRVVVRVFASIMTNIVVFLPLAFMGGIAGQFMRQFGISVVFLVLISSLFSFTLTPMMIAQILKVKKTRSKQEIKDKRNKKLAWFKPIFEWQVAHPWRAIGVAFLALFLSLIPMRWVGNEFASSVDTNEIHVLARAKVGTVFSHSVEIASDIESKLNGISEIDYIMTKIGERGVQNIDVKIGLKDVSERSKSDRELSREILPKLYEIPNMEFQIFAGEGAGGANMNDLVLNIYGDDDSLRNDYANQVLELINQIPEIQTAILTQQSPGTEMRFVPNEKQMRYWGVKNATVGATLRAALYGNDDYKFKQNGDEFPIVIELSPEHKTNDLFKNVYVNTPKGLVALGVLGEIQNTNATPDIKRLDKKRITEIGINLGKSTIGPVQQKIESELATIEWADGYSAGFGGMSEMQSESNGELGAAFLLATILTFMTLAAILNSLRQPFTMMSAVLISFTGVFVLMFLVGANINIAALMSLIMLVALSINANILVIEPAMAEMNGGKPAVPALWDEFRDKHRMLLMTTIAVVAGLLPQLWAADGVKVSMGAVIIGGTLASLLWTYCLTPAVFVLMERLGKRNR